MKRRAKVPQPKPTARAAALRVLTDFDKGRFPEDALTDHGAGLDPRDRALAAALAYGVLRWRSRLDYAIRLFLDKPGKRVEPTVLNILRLGLFQLQGLDRVPASAAVNESVNLAKSFGPSWASGLVNAVLRRLAGADTLPDPAHDTRLSEIERLSLHHAHPSWLTEKWLTELGIEETSALLAANNDPAPLTLRVNLARIDRPSVLDRLNSSGIAAQGSPWTPAGIRIAGPTGPVSELPGFREGWFAVQDEASQIVGLLATGTGETSLLDACAGRGSKAIHAAERTGALVFALDTDRRRMSQSLEEAGRLGVTPPALVQGDLTRPPFHSERFDAVLVDAPCSNLGVIRRRPDVKWLKTREDPERLAAVQAGLLASAANLVRPGGRLIYAVCTVTPEETDRLADRFAADHPDFAPESAADYLPESARPLVDPRWRVRAWPHRHGTDGFFAAVFRHLKQYGPDWEARTVS